MRDAICCSSEEKLTTVCTIKKHQIPKNMFALETWSSLAINLPHTLSTLSVFKGCFSFAYFPRAWLRTLNSQDPILDSLCLHCQQLSVKITNKVCIFTFLQHQYGAEELKGPSLLCQWFIQLLTQASHGRRFLFFSWYEIHTPLPPRKNTAIKKWTLMVKKLKYLSHSCTQMLYATAFN